MTKNVHIRAPHPFQFDSGASDDRTPQKQIQCLIIQAIRMIAQVIYIVQCAHNIVLPPASHPEKYSFLFSNPTIGATKKMRLDHSIESSKTNTKHCTGKRHDEKSLHQSSSSPLWCSKNYVDACTQTDPQIINIQIAVHDGNTIFLSSK